MESTKKVTSSALSRSSVQRWSRSYSKTNVVIVIAIALFCQSYLVRGGVDESEKVYKTGIPSEDHEISIVIAKSQKEQELSNELKNDYYARRNFNVNEDGGEEDDGSGNSTAGSESTTFDKCGPGAKCCYQYTWAGYQDMDTIPAAANSTCEYLRKSNRISGTSACFDPLVYTRAAGDKALGTPPNFTMLKQSAEMNNWNIYCPMTDKNCVTYTFYSRDGNKRMANQTNFCGVVTNVNTGNRITNGCHRENVGGYIREVCVCSRTMCNGQSSLFSSIPVKTLLLALGFSFILLYRTR